MDPKPRLPAVIKLAIKNHLILASYKATEKRMYERLHEIITANTLAARYIHKSFNYRGNLYSKEAQQLRFNAQRLIPELHPEMDKWLKDVLDIDHFEKPFIVGLFTHMLNITSSVEDYLLLMPECLAPAIRNSHVTEEFLFPRQLSDEAIEAFKIQHEPWIFKLKSRMVLELILS